MTWSSPRIWRSGRGVPLAVLLLGIVDVLSAVSRPERHRLNVLIGVIPLGLIHAAAALTAALGVLLIMLSRGLRRRKRLAWEATTVVVGMSVGLHLAKGLDVEEATLSVGLLAWLLLTRSAFPAQGDPRARWRAPIVFLRLVAVDLVVGYVLVDQPPDRIVSGNRSVARTLETVMRGLAGINGPLTLRRNRGDAIGDILLALGCLTVLATAYLVLRPPGPLAGLSDDDELRLRQLLERHGRNDSLGYFALRRDKSVVFSPTGKAAVAFRVVRGCILASGDPIGDVEAWPGAIRAWLELAQRHAWIPAAVGCSELGAQVWEREAGFDALELGDEAVVDVASHSLEGRAMRGVRQAVARVERAGYDVSVRRVGTIGPREKQRLRAQAAHWRDTQTERGFSMALGRLGAHEDDDCIVVTAERNGNLVAFLHFVPWGPDGLSLDVMRREADCENGINELLIVSALRAAPGLGVKRLSLNFAVFRSALDRGQRIGAGPVLRVWTAILLVASKWVQIESLHRFNAKFQPEWHPRFISYANARDLPQIGVAYLEAEAFIAVPAWRWPGRRDQQSSDPDPDPLTSDVEVDASASAPGLGSEGASAD
jgi:lysyl-tRNA synthetase class 2